MTAKHTPGPWWPSKNCTGSWDVKTYRDSSDMTPKDEEAVNWPYGATICMSIGDHTEKRTSGNEEANARLIASAPELLSFIESLTDAAGPYPFIDGTQLVIDARAVIAKATGGGDV